MIFPQGLYGGFPITHFDITRAGQILANLPLSPANRRLADYWLELWDGDLLPLRARFSPARVRDLLPGIMIQEIEPGKRVCVRLCGTAITEAFGRDLTGADLIAISPDDTREARLAYHNLIAEGAIGFGVRRSTTRYGMAAESQELHLPLRDMMESGGRLVLFHSDWRARGAHPGVAEVPDVLSCPVEVRAMPLSEDGTVRTWSRPARPE